MIIPAFKKLSGSIGADRVIWRYDPIFISEKYSIEYHVRTFGKIAEQLHNYTRKVTISFLDEDYKGVKDNIKELALKEFLSSAKNKLSSQLAEVSHSYNLLIDTCAEQIDLGQFGIGHACSDS